MVVKSIRVNYNRSSTADGPVQASFVGIRNALRTSLHPTDQFIVSDIAQWNQIISSITYRVWAFLVRKIGSGQEWLIGGGHRVGSSSVTSSLVNLVYGNWSTTSNVLLAPSESVDAWSFFIHYNEKQGSGSTYQFGFNDTLNLTYDGGDFTTPAININTEAFWPATAASMYRGRFVELGGAATTTGRGYNLLFCFETEAPLCLLQFQGAQQHIPTSLSCYGNIMNPSTTGDTDTSGVFGCTYAYDETAGSGYFGRIVSPWAHFKNDSGAIISNGSFTVQGVYNFNNELDTNGNFKRRSMSVQSSTYTKGILNPNYFFEIGAFEQLSRDGLRLVGPVCSLCKVNGAFCIPLETTIPYPINLQDGITLFS